MEKKIGFNISPIVCYLINALIKEKRSPINKRTLFFLPLLFAVFSGFNCSSDSCTVSMNWRINYNNTIPDLTIPGTYNNVEAEFEVVNNSCGTPDSGKFRRMIDTVTIQSGKIQLYDTYNTATTSSSSKVTFRVDGSGNILSAGLGLLLNFSEYTPCVDVGLSTIGGGVNTIEASNIIINDSIAWSKRDCYFNYLWGTPISTFVGGPIIR